MKKITLENRDLVNQLKNMGLEVYGVFPRQIVIQGEEIKDKIWFFNSTGKVNKTGEVNSAKHKMRIRFGNAFETQAQAEAVRNAIKGNLCAK